MQQQESILAKLNGIPAFQAVQTFADLMLRFGRDDYGPVSSPLFAGQLNVLTRRIPAGTAEDPGLFHDNREVEGCAPFCQNLLFDFGLLDVLAGLARVTGNPAYDAARREHLEYFLAHCIHPRSGCFPWGEHVGFDLVRDAIHQGVYKRWHEVKVVLLDWDQLWEINPSATRREIETVFYNHICDDNTFAFNRHADMAGKPNRGGGPGSLASTAGVFLYAWAWLFRKTGDRKFLDWSRRIHRLYQCPSVTGLFPTDEGRPEELWYADVLGYACQLLRAAEVLGDDGRDFREDALRLLHAYHRCAYDPTGPGFFDTLNIVTGKPVVGPSKHYPDISRPRYLEAWTCASNSTHLPALAITSAAGYAATGDPLLRTMFDQALALLDIPQHVADGTPMQSGDVAGVLLGLVHVAKRDGKPEYLSLARLLVGHTLKNHRKNGLFTSGVKGGGNYYSARAGSNDLAAALLAFAFAESGRADLAPPIRNPLGTMPW